MLIQKMTTAKNKPKIRKPQAPKEWLSDRIVDLRDLLLGENTLR